MECTETSCKNGGTCREVVGGDFTCTCAQGYIYNHLQISVIFLAPL